ncbi:hypothetical protein BHE74_00039302 [Ensete ventricosum]|nr:hypothetical protein GW17_00008977 [Ensete ventricosum]RWW54137.1 hypothetical protein BHE74_00039302 [Ensete ventricosum]RZS14579.1 hypothetical protein BHM03_00046279 [Ensete ventricosum]
MKQRCVSGNTVVSSIFYLVKGEIKEDTGKGARTVVAFVVPLSLAPFRDLFVVFLPATDDVGPTRSPATRIQDMYEVKDPAIKLFGATIPVAAAALPPAEADAVDVEAKDADAESAASAAVGQKVRR